MIIFQKILREIMQDLQHFKNESFKCSLSFNLSQLKNH
ncbi:hypothetical protein predicted by Glimmer/Critica [Helicobacter pylori B8]|uniref:Uncharacterized protein n=1 Tax=Helicobacter pylori (strain B8) TaxID=693745 RepID=D7FD16_HELP3|nr:hypothetical protein predicted by Glimmer/Critica [Helicobacter pylori B8]